MKKVMSFFFVALLVSVLFTALTYTHRYQTVPAADRWYEKHTKGHSTYAPDLVKVYPVHDTRVYERIVHCSDFYSYRSCDRHAERTRIVYYRPGRYNHPHYW